MHSYQESVAGWSTIVGTLGIVFGLIQSRGWLAGIGVLFAAASILGGSDGISKKIAVPFLKPLMAQEPFSVLLKCELPGCMKAGLEYYTSTLSFGQDQVQRCTVRLLFVGVHPAWMRVYESDASGN